MAVSLQKGQRVSLEKGLTKALVGLGWDTNKYDGGYDFDLDASAFLLGADGKCLREEDFVFYNNLNGRDGAVVHTGDNRVGSETGKEGDDEVIMLDFSRLPSEIQKIAICVTIHEADIRHQNFGQVSNAYVRVARVDDPEDYTGTDLIRFDLEEDFSIETAIVVCEIYRRNGEWKFNAVAAGFQGGLAALVRNYGLSVQ